MGTEGRQVIAQAQKRSVQAIADSAGSTAISALIVAEQLQREWVFGAQQMATAIDAYKSGDTGGAVMWAIGSFGFASAEAFNPVGKAAAKASRLMSGQIGRAGEQAVRGAYEIGKKLAIEVSGRVRIPDGLTATTLSEVKNVSSLSFTAQLRDYQAYALRTGVEFNLYVRPDTALSGPLQNAIRSGDINLLLIPPY